MDDDEFCREGARDDAGDTARGTAMVFSWSMEEANVRHLSFSVVPVAVVLAFEEEVKAEEEDTQDVSDRGDFLPMARGPRTTAILVDW